MSFSSPFWLLLLVALPALLYLSRSGSIALRIWLSMLLVSVAIAAAGPRAGARPDGRRIFLLIDRSASFRAERSLRELEGLADRLTPRDRLWIVPYGRQPALAAGPISPSGLSEALGGLASAVVDGGGSSLAEALRFVGSLDARPGEVLVIGDGIDTRPGLWLAPPGKRVTVLAPAAVPDLRVVRVVTPARLLPGAAFQVLVEVGGTAAAQGVLELRRGGRVVAAAPVRLSGPGRVTLLLADRIDRPGWVDWQVVLRAAGRELSEANNVYPLRRRVGGRPGLLWVGESRTSKKWGGLLARQAQVQHVSPGRLTAEHLVDVDAVVLENLSGTRVDRSVEARLLRFVEGGGGCLFLGGARSLADGGWIGRPLEKRLPVWLRPRSEPRPPAAVSVLVDCSGSMERKLGLARRALLELIDGLPVGTRLTVWAIAVPHRRLLGPVVLGPDRAPVRERLQLFAQGGTAFGPVLRAARQGLAGAERFERHMILISDGQTAEEPAGGTFDAGPMTGITVTMLLLQADAPSAPLRRWLGTVGGRVDPVRRIEDLPRMLLARYKERRWDLVARGVHPVGPGPAREALGTLAELDFPPLAGCGRVSLQPGGELLLETKGTARLPVYARRALGGARVAYLGLDLDGPWGKAYRDWPETPRLLAHAALWAATGRRRGPIALQAAFVDGRVEATVVVRDGSGPRRLVVRARSRGREASTRLSPAGIDLYRGELELDAAPGGAWTVALHDLERPGRPLAVTQVSAPYGPELARLRPQTDALRALARASGGGVISRASGYRPGTPARLPGRPLARLIWLLAALWLLIGVFGTRHAG